MSESLTQMEQTNLQIHSEIYKERLCLYNLVLEKALETFLWKDSPQLVGWLTLQLSGDPECLYTKSWKDFASFLLARSRKINIKQNLCIISLCTKNAFWLAWLLTLTQLNPIDHKALEEVVQHWKNSTCSLDALSTSFFTTLSIWDGGMFSSIRCVPAGLENCIH